MNSGRRSGRVRLHLNTRSGGAVYGTCIHSTDRCPHRSWRNFCVIGTEPIDLVDHFVVARQRREDVEACSDRWQCSRGLRTPGFPDADNYLRLEDQAGAPGQEEKENGLKGTRMSSSDIFSLSKVSDIDSFGGRETVALVDDEDRAT